MDSEFAHGTGLAIAESSRTKQLRVAFESQLRIGEESSIETWLSKVSTAEQPVLFRELLEVELSFFTHQGKVLHPEDYLVRFPDFVREIELVFQSYAREGSSGPDDRSMNSTIDAAPSATSHIEEWTNWSGGDLVGRYRLDEFVGRGKFGEVWKGFDPELKRLVAIKLPRREILDRLDLSSQFRDEARRAASLKHEGIVPVYDIGQVGKGIFIVSEFIDGPTLAERMKAGRISREESIRIIGHLAVSLHQAHRAGLVHRDIKPSNVLLRPDGTPAIADFGLAISELEQLTAASGVVGTVAYMSPEQARGEGHLVDGRSDLYSLGVIFYQLLTDRHPYQFKTSSDLMEQIIHREIRPPRSIDDTIPPALERICLRCLSKDVRGRYSTGRDLADDLQEWNSPSRKLSRNKVIAMITLATVLTIGIGLFALGPKRKDPSLPRPEEGAVNAATPTNKWLSMLNQPLEKVACLKGDPTDFSQQDEQNQTLNLRSERNLWILASAHSARRQFRLQASVLMDEGPGSVGFVWGLEEDSNALPKKQRQCFALLIQRFAPKGSAVLSLQRLTIGEFLVDVPWLEKGAPTWVNGNVELARTPFDRPIDQFVSLEVAVDGASVDVFSNGESVWKTNIVDQKMREALLHSEGPLGLAGYGKSVVFRDAAVKFLTSTREDNQ